MLEIPESLRSLFTASIEEDDGEYVVRVPESEVENDAVAVGERYRVALVAAPPPAGESDDTRGRRRREASTRGRDQSGGTGERAPTPPVEEGEVRQVTVEAVGDQGDGIAKVERGYVVIVPDARPGDEPTVEIEEVQQNVAFARVVSGRT
jgi:predicted RNA-binding protein with TRAM domain